MSGCRWCDVRGNCTSLCVATVRVRRGIETPPEPQGEVSDRGPYDPNADYRNWPLGGAIFALAVPFGVFLTFALIGILKALGH